MPGTIVFFLLVAIAILASAIANLHNISTILEERSETIMADITAFAAAFGTFAEDFGKFAEDFSAFMAAQPPSEDPAIQQKIDGFTETVTNLDTSVKLMDTQLNPPAETPANG